MSKFSPACLNRLRSRRVREMQPLRGPKLKVAHSLRLREVREDNSVRGLMLSSHRQDLRLSVVKTEEASMSALMSLTLVKLMSTF